MDSSDGTSGQLTWVPAVTKTRHYNCLFGILNVSENPNNGDVKRVHNFPVPTYITTSIWFRMRANVTFFKIDTNTQI